MTISTMINELQGHLTTLGDVQVFVDLKNMENNIGHEEYSYENTVHLIPEKISIGNIDEPESREENVQVLSIKIADIG